MNINKEKIIKAFEDGDSMGLNEIDKQLKHINDVDGYIESKIEDLLICIFKLNYILVETESENYASKYNMKVQELYSEMKADLFERLGITK